MSSEKGAVGNGSIPATSRKVVQSLKEIVNCPEAEIYAMLRECNMDPNETVSRLLSQDPFHEVKSKREKKKENKDTNEYKTRGVGNSSSRGGRGATDRRTGPTHYNYSESGSAHERSVNRSDGTYCNVAPHSSASHVAVADVNQHFSSFSDDALKASQSMTAIRGDGFPSSVQSAAGLPSAWQGGNAGHLSMADIVKKGIPQNNTPGPRPDTVPTQHKDDWPAIERPQASAFPCEYAVGNLEVTDRHHSQDNHNVKSNGTPPKDKKIDSVNEHHIASTTNSSPEEENAGDASYYENCLFEDSNLYQNYGNAYQHEEAEDNCASLSNIAANMQQLNLETDEQAQQPKEEIHSVVIPDHLQVQSSACLNLCFGSFGAGISTGLAGTSTADPLHNDVKATSKTEDSSPDVLSNYRNAEYDEDEQVRSTSTVDITNRSCLIDETQTSVSPSHPEVIKHSFGYEVEGAQYGFQNSLPASNFDNSHQHKLTTVYSQSQTSSQMQHTTSYSDVLAFTNLLRASMLASTVHQPGRESDRSYLQFHANQLMAAKYDTTVPVGGPSASVAEALETRSMNSSQQVLPSANAAALGSGLPQHLTMHPSQSTLPLGPFANMISYPLLPPSYAYMPSAIQQAFSGNSSYHQSLAPVLPQYENNLSVNNLPQPGAVPSGYGSFGGNSTNVPGNYLLNQNANPGGSSIGYDELGNPRYREQLLALQQNDNSAMYSHGNGNRTMSAFPANTYYNHFQEQNQQTAGFHQNQQQPSQHFGSQGYPNFYHSQSGMSLEHHHQQNQRDGSIGGSQVQPSKQS